MGAYDALEGARIDVLVTGEIDRPDAGTLAFVDCSLRVGEKEVVRGRAVFAVLDR